MNKLFVLGHRALLIAGVAGMFLGCSDDDGGNDADTGSATDSGSEVASDTAMDTGSEVTSDSAMDTGSAVASDSSMDTESAVTSDSTVDTGSEVTSDSTMDTESATSSGTDSATEVDTAAILSAWSASPHGDTAAEAFHHWDGDDPAEVPTGCARCHTTTGYVDYAADGVVDAAVPITDTAAPEVVGCAACHSPEAEALTTVTFPSGAAVSDLGPEARCMTCHQGRESTVSVDQAIVAAAAAAADTDTTDSAVETDSVVVDPDAVYPGLSFRNIHYLAAGATRYGAVAAGGYQFEGKSYDGYFAHFPGVESCIDCHDQHSLELKTAVCTTCHGSTAPQDIRVAGSWADYDGDGDTDEGISQEIAGLTDRLYLAIQDYAANLVGTPIAYTPSAYPYFFVDTNGNGTVDTDEANFMNRYATWTPTLLRAAYNYQFAQKDPGAYAHNAKYVIALLYDSLEALGSDVSPFARNDGGHFDGAAEAFRHWDEDGAVSANCAQCHSADGARIVATTGAAPTEAQPLSDGLTCASCHDSVAQGAVSVYSVASVTFPGGAQIANTSEDPGFLCMVCHQGRESGATIDAHIAEVAADTDPSASLQFQNVHYLPAGGVLYGSEAALGYQYAGATYAGANGHAGNNSCLFCHEPSAANHSFAPLFRTGTCDTCHAGAASIEDLRAASSDYTVIQALTQELYAALQAYASTTVGTPIVYSPNAYPYFFVDSNANGAVDDGEATFMNRYAAWDETLLKAAHNFQIANKEPGAWAHNGTYMIQLLYDSIVDLGATPSVARP